MEVTKNMDLKDFVKSGGLFLKAEDILANPNAKFVIKDEGEVVLNKFGNSRLHLTGEFNGEQRVFDCGKTNADKIVQVLGAESKNWIGRVIVFQTYRTKTSDGKLVDALDIKEVK